MDDNEVELVEICTMFEVESALRYYEGHNRGYIMGFARHDHRNGWDAYRKLVEIQKSRPSSTPELGFFSLWDGVGVVASTSLLGVPLGHNSSFLQRPAFAHSKIRQAIWCGSTNSTTEEGI
ncbi:hypothetical protein ACFX16_013208 [Malus domestica]